MPPTNQSAKKYLVCLALPLQLLFLALSPHHPLKLLGLSYLRWEGGE